MFENPNRTEILRTVYGHWCSSEDNILHRQSTASSSSDAVDKIEIPLFPFSRELISFDPLRDDQSTRRRAGGWTHGATYGAGEGKWRTRRRISSANLKTDFERPASFWSASRSGAAAYTCTRRRDILSRDITFCPRRVCAGRKVVETGNRYKRTDVSTASPGTSLVPIYQIRKTLRTAVGGKSSTCQAHARFLISSRVACG